MSQPEVARNGEALIAGHDDLAQAVLGSGLFTGLPGRAIHLLTPALRVKKFADEEIVCHCPDAAHDAFVVLSGTVAVTRLIDDLDYVVDLSGRGAVFNVAQLLDVDMRHAGARAAGAVSLIAVDSAALRRLIDENREIGLALIRNLGRLLAAQMDRQLVHCLKTPSP